MPSTAVNFSKKCLVIVTGASRGIGQTIAVEVSRRMKNPSKIILIARSEEGLLKTQQLISEANNTIVVEKYPLDLSTATNKQYEEIFAATQDTYDISMMFHNAGQIGTLKETTELNDLTLWRNYFDLNMFSVVLLNSVYIRTSALFSKRQFVINISSLCGHKPFTNTALYGSAKAARDLFFSVLAEERKETVVLKYCPGPVDTDMFNEVISNAQSKELRDQFSEMKNAGVLSTDQTVQKLMSILENGKYKSGDLIDYYD